jgi:2-oxoglutarate dehydrogenase E2 component (dihydrolipoamide succinyltransferase)
MATELRVPTLGESVTEATIGRWFKKKGDAIAVDEPVVELETDKVTVEVPAPAAGVLDEISVKEGDTVEVGALLGMISEGGGKAASGNGGAKSEAAPAAKEAKPAAPAKGGKTVEVNVPSAGESVTEAQVGEIYKKAGDAVKADEPILELETDKAAQEVMAPVDGVLAEIVVKSGDEVKVGQLLARISEGASSGTAEPETKPEAVAQAAGSSGAKSGREAEEKTADVGGSPPIEERKRPPSPSAQKLMTENRLTTSDVAGSGKEGQVLKGDVLSAIETGRGTGPPAPPPASRPRCRRSRAPRPRPRTRCARSA